VGGARKHRGKADEERLNTVAWKPPERRADESELLDILLREAIVGVPGFDWKRRKNVLYEEWPEGSVALGGISPAAREFLR
jgi:hypothetical protein